MVNNLWICLSSSLCFSACTTERGIEEIKSKCEWKQDGFSAVTTYWSDSIPGNSPASRTRINTEEGEGAEVELSGIPAGARWKKMTPLKDAVPE